MVKRLFKNAKNYKVLKFYNFFLALSQKNKEKKVKGKKVQIN